jgi:hypothetical protein
VLRPRLAAQMRMFVSVGSVSGWPRHHSRPTPGRSPSFVAIPLAEARRRASARGAAHPALKPSSRGSVNSPLPLLRFGLSDTASFVVVDPFGLVEV